MPPLTIEIVLQVVLALGLLNVWLVRGRAATTYRGGAATSLADEFEAYGLPKWFFYLIGALKLACAALLLAGVWIPALVQPAAGLLVALMLGALAMHAKVKDPALKSLPAFLMLALSATLLVLALS